jgi:FkbM family methyltransferase
MLKSAFKKIYRLYKPRKIASQREIECAERIFYINYLKEGMVAFDVGANVGELSLLFSRFVGRTGIVHAFEASSACFRKLETVCQIAGLSQIIPNHYAISEKESVVKLYIYDEEHSTWNSLADRPLHQYGIDVKTIATEEVQAITIDKYCREHGIHNIDLLKIDVEGAEYQVLLGAKELFENRKIQCCVFEFGATTFDMGNSPNDIENFFRDHHYEVRNLMRGFPNFPGRSSSHEAQFSIHVATPRMQK